MQTKETHQCAPVWENILNFRERLKAPFYCPGHKGGRTLPMELAESFGASDLNNLPDTDTLHCPSGPIQAAEELLADAYAVRRSFMMVGGSSLGNMAAVMSVAGPGDRVIVQRNAHKSIIAGIIHSGAVPHWLVPTWDHRFGLVHGLKTSDVARGLEQFPDAKALVVLNPTYFGVVANLPAMASLTRQHSAVLIADEAHGAHFRFAHSLCDQFPQAAENCGADIVIQSTHKILSALSQAAVLHVCSDKIDPLRVQAVLQSLQTTSPNFAIMASIDLARRQMMLEGDTLVGHLLELAQETRVRLSKINGLRVMGSHDALGIDSGFSTLDPTKLLIDTSQLGWSGMDAQRFLNERFGVQPELSGPTYLLCIMTIGSQQRDCDLLVDALSTLASTAPASMYQTEKPATAAFHALLELAGRVSSTLPEYVLSPREAFYAPFEYTSLDEAVGRTAAEIVTPYPPGIPIIMPGERFNSEIVELLRSVRAVGCPISAVDPTLAALRVVR